ncbi:MAG: hypothetical protein KDH17_00585 [Rhodocyclaceae bacterium]|nr:hypothetical protein [Rhodocyclaceae bacterium]
MLLIDRKGVRTGRFARDVHQRSRRQSTCDCALAMVEQRRRPGIAGARFRLTIGPAAHRLRPHHVACSHSDPSCVPLCFDFAE